LTQVNDWLKFAEAKNVGIVGLDSGAIAVLMTYITGEHQYPVLAGILVIVGGVALIGSLLIGLSSFFPQTNLEDLLGGRLAKPSGADNLHFYGHLAKYMPNDLAAAVARRYAGAEPVGFSELQVDLAEQVVTNARITLHKLRLFAVAVALFGLGVLASAAGVLITSVT
jgi:hypothetical protein